MEEKKKKKILWLSSFSKTKTGFGRHSREILSYLHKTGKYEIVEYATWPFRLNDENCKNMPWKCYGSAPDRDEDIRKLQTDPAVFRGMQYGAVFIDKLIKQEKPDVFFGVEDIWAFGGYWKKPWWNKLHCVLWTTLDSLPIFKQAHKNADKVLNYWVWASFAEKAMHKLGYPHVKTVTGAFDTSKFFPIVPKDRASLRARFGIKDETIFGFVFRNQPRKLVGQLIEGFSIYKKRNPLTKAKLLLHTHWEESWNIKDFMEEFGVETEDVLTTYICSNCSEFDIRPYSGQGTRCRFCGGDKCASNPNTTFGVNEEQLNLIYNIMDAYVHPMTSGGLEMPLVEALLAGKPCATVDYACGSDYTDQSFVYSLEYNTGREPVSNFIKAHVRPQSIANFFNKIETAKSSKILEWSQKGRKWAQERFDTKVIGKQVEDFLDGLPEVKEGAFDFVDKKFDDTYPFQDEDQITSDLEWLLDLYGGIFGMIEDENSIGVRNWLGKLSKGEESRESIYNRFIEIAKHENSLAPEEQKSIKDLFTTDKKYKLLYIIPESIGDCMVSQSVIEALQEKYPPEEWEFYVATQPKYFEVFDHIPNIKLVQYTPSMDNYQWCEGAGPEEGLVDIAFHPYFGTQRAVSYIHNGKDTNYLQPFSPVTA